MTEVLSSEPGWFHMGAIAVAIFDEPTATNRRSLRRAVAGLRSGGQVRTRRWATTHSESGAWCWTAEPALSAEEVEQERRSRGDRWPRIGSIYSDRVIYYPEIPEGAIDVDDPMFYPGGTVTWFRLPKVPPRWDTWVTLVREQPSSGRTWEDNAHEFARRSSRT